MKTYRLVLQKSDGTNEVIKTGLTEKQAIEYFYGIDNTYYEEEGLDTETKICLGVALFYIILRPFINLILDISSIVINM